MISVHLQGGLGNQLFQLAFLEYISKITGKEPFLHTLQSPSTIHSSEQYFNTVFKTMRNLLKPVNEHPLIFKEPYLQPYMDWKPHVMGCKQTIIFNGYFQRFEYMNIVRDTFIPKLSFDDSVLQKYPQIENKIGIHIRGGDYKNNPYHDLSLKKYYEKCIALCPDSEFVIFTNDVPYANTIIPYCEIIHESEVNTLFLMSRCKGLICANSSFSWWGAYLNPHRPIFMPSKWYPHNSQGNYYFNGVTLVDINV